MNLYHLFYITIKLIYAGQGKSNIPLFLATENLLEIYLGEFFASLTGVHIYALRKVKFAVAQPLVFVLVPVNRLNTHDLFRNCKGYILQYLIFLSAVGNPHLLYEDARICLACKSIKVYPILEIISRSSESEQQFLPILTSICEPFFYQERRLIFLLNIIYNFWIKNSSKKTFCGQIRTR